MGEGTRQPQGPQAEGKSHPFQAVLHHRHTTVHVGEKNFKFLTEAGETAQCLTAHLLALPEDPNSVLAPTQGGSQALVTPAPDALLPVASKGLCIHVHSPHSPSTLNQLIN